jgi:choline dehydrogenase
MRVMVNSLRFILKLAASQPLASVIESRVRPTGALASDDALAEHARATCKTTYHPTCTCAMGPSENGAVVDPELRVYGVAGLRVIDASIMPSVISGNTSAPTTMIAEKGADLLRAQYAS